MALSILRHLCIRSHARNRAEFHDFKLSTKPNRLPLPTAKLDSFESNLLVHTLSAESSAKTGQTFCWWRVCDFGFGETANSSNLPCVSMFGAHPLIATLSYSRLCYKRRLLYRDNRPPQAGSRLKTCGVVQCCNQSAPRCSSFMSNVKRLQHIKTKWQFFSPYVTASDMGYYFILRICYWALFIVRWCALRMRFQSFPTLLTLTSEARTIKQSGTLVNEEI